MKNLKATLETSSQFELTSLLTIYLITNDSIGLEKVLKELNFRYLPSKTKEIMKNAKKQLSKHL
jgi:hypothetical protein